MKTNLLGAIGAIIITTYVAVESSSTAFVFNFPSIVIVVGGTICAAILSYGVRDTMGTMVKAIRVFNKQTHGEIKVINDLIALSKNRFAHGHLASEKIQNIHPFIQDGVRLIENDFSSEQIENLMSSAMLERGSIFNHEIEVLKALSKYPPAFGMIGTVIGLMGILSNLSKTGAFQEMGPAMGIALLTTLYGLLIANYIFAPLADNLQHRLDKDMKERRIIVEGIILLKENEDPVFLEEYLAVKILPTHRSLVGMAQNIQ